MQKQNRFKSLLWTSLGIAIISASVLLVYHFSSRLHGQISENASTAEVDLYADGVQKVFEKRCVECHSCNNAPCQLNLTSYENLMRGASKALVYNSLRTHPIAPTRIGEDATTEADWRKKGFFSVLEGPSLTKTPFMKMLTSKLEAEKSGNTAAKDPLAVNDSHQCPAQNELDKFFASRPLAGMPYSFRGLSNTDLNTIAAWLQAGSPPPRSSSLPTASTDEVQLRGQWEEFLNAGDIKSKIVSRYLFEHLFLAHVHFNKSPSSFYRLVRSRSACASGVDDIATRRPNDDPKGAFFYCFKPLYQVIAEKTHLPYLMDAAKLEWVRKNFYAEDWAAKALPSYESQVSANPFKTFKDIPVEARFRFLIEDSQYQIGTFIKGPVCNGQGAVSSIDEQFYVFFFDPKSDLMVKDAGFKTAAQNLLALPAENGSDPSVPQGAYYLNYYPRIRNAYRTLRQKTLKKQYPQGLGLENIWNGDGQNENAVVTVFRHNDHSYVLKGARGDASPSAYILDYALFERLVYNLVVGFDVYGNFTHQFQTRVYMGMIRMEGENNFLDFVPQPLRASIRADWYPKMSIVTPEKLFIDQRIADDHPSRITLAATAPQAVKAEMYAKILAERIPHMVERYPDPFNWRHLEIKTAGFQREDVDAGSPALAELAAMSPEAGANWVTYFPDSVMVAITGPDRVEQLWTLVRNKKEQGVGSLLFENVLRQPEKDTLVLIRDIGSSFPNYIFSVPVGEVQSFVKAMTQVASAENFASVKAQWGRESLDTKFWHDSDLIHEYIKRKLGVEAGTLDYTRYDIWK